MGFGFLFASNQAAKSAVLCVDCFYCSEQIALTRSPNLAEQFSVACPKCGRRAQYDKSQARPIAARGAAES